MKSAFQIEVKVCMSNKKWWWWWWFKWIVSWKHSFDYVSVIEE